MHPVTLAALGIAVSMAGVMVVERRWPKLAWAGWVVSGILILAMGRMAQGDPYALYNAFGREVSALILILVMGAGCTTLATCLGLALLWAGRKLYPHSPLFD